MGDVSDGEATIGEELRARWRDGNKRMAELRAMVEECEASRDALAAQLMAAEAAVTVANAEFSQAALDVRAVQNDAWRAMSTALDAALEVPAEPADAVP